ncbi:MAG: TerB family tellurite resistance protein [Rhodobacteraceae bacterium]|nr:TerB family tellurite resistance protein [Paracoccaceae bacterium]
MDRNCRERLMALDIDSVIVDLRAFKTRLAIGSNEQAVNENFAAFEQQVDLADADGEGGSSSMVAVRQFKESAFLKALGLTTTFTPVGWVFFAASVSGVGYMAVRRQIQFRAGPMGDVPSYVRTPIDQFAVEIFALLAPLALKIAGADGEFHVREIARVQRHFTRSWGYDPAFVELGIECLKEELELSKTEDVAREFAQLCKATPECKYQAIKFKLVSFLMELIEADGMIYESEVRELRAIQKVFDEVEAEQQTVAMETAGIT